MNNRGSGIIAVIIIGFIMLIYVSTIFSKVQNYTILNNKYRNQIKNYYYYEDLNYIYESLVN